MITTVIFDLDDTLYDEIDYCRSGFAAIARLLASMYGTAGEAEIFETLWRLFESGNRTNTFNAALAQLKLPCSPELIAKLVDVYRNHKPDIALPTSSKAVLNTLLGKYTLALLTDGFLPAQELKVEALGIKHCFKVIVYTEKMGRQFWKPSPAGFEQIVSQLNVSAKTCVYIGDNEVKDFIGPNRLGIVTIRLTRPNGIHIERGADQDAPARYTIKDITELPSLVETL
jgi:putative hydrolase of the HAD superfamily